MQGKNPTTGKMSIDLRVGETLRVGDALIRLERKDGRRVRLLVQAPRTTKIQPPAKPRAQECASTHQPEEGAGPWPIPSSTLPASAS